MRLRIILCFIVGALTASTAEAKSYSADRFDSRIQVRAGGSMEVTETIVFRFTGGAFSRVFRVIPSRRTDGIEILRASMDGLVFPQGKEAGQLEISRQSGVRATWHFAPISDSTHTFELTYIVRGLVRQEGNADVFAWRALPTEHDYAIASAAIDIDFPSEPIAAPSVTTHRVESESVRTEETHVRIDAGGIRSNGWVEGRVRLPRGALVATPPLWQQRSIRADGFARVWIGVAAIVAVSGLLLLLMIRLSYDPPSIEPAAEQMGPALPDALSPASAGALVSNGRNTLEHAMATLFALAARGELTIREERKALGQRDFLMTRSPTGASLSETERRVVEIVFSGRHGAEPAVSLRTARGRLTRRARVVASAVTEDLASAGLIDEHRKAVRRRFLNVGIGGLIAGALGGLVAGVLAETYGPWPILVMAAFLLVGVAGLITHAAATPLSDEGLRRARMWRGLQKYLRDVARDRATPPATGAANLLPFAIALGLAPAWSRYLKNHHEAVPAWFQAVAAGDASQAFAAFVVYGGASAGGHGGAGGGAAAGGGASGAA